MGVETRESGKEYIPRFFYAGNPEDTYRTSDSGETEGAGPDRQLAGRADSLHAHACVQDIQYAAHQYGAAAADFLHFRL